MPRCLSTQPAASDDPFRPWPAAAGSPRSARRSCPTSTGCSNRVFGGRVLMSSMMLPCAIVTTTGRKSGLPRESPLATVPLDGCLYVVGSNFGRPHHPAWSWNLLADPTAQVSFRGEHFAATAELLDEDEKAGDLAPSDRALAAVRPVRRAQRTRPAGVPPAARRRSTRSAERAHFTTSGTVVVVVVVAGRAVVVVGRSGPHRGRRRRGARLTRRARRGAWWPARSWSGRAGSPLRSSSTRSMSPEK